MRSTASIPFSPDLKKTGASDENDRGGNGGVGEGDEREGGGGARQGRCLESRTFGVVHREEARRAREREHDRSLRPQRRGSQASRVRTAPRPLRRVGAFSATAPAGSGNMEPMVRTSGP